MTSSEHRTRVRQLADWLEERLGVIDVYEQRSEIAHDLLIWLKDQGWLEENK